MRRYITLTKMRAIAVRDPLLQTNILEGVCCQFVDLEWITITVDQSNELDSVTLAFFNVSVNSPDSNKFFIISHPPTNSVE